MSQEYELQGCMIQNLGDCEIWIRIFQLSKIWYSVRSAELLQIVFVLIGASWKEEDRMKATLLVYISEIPEPDVVCDWQLMMSSQMPFNDSHFTNDSSKRYHGTYQCCIYVSVFNSTVYCCPTQMIPCRIRFNIQIIKQDVRVTAGFFSSVSLFIGQLNCIKTLWDHVLYLIRGVPFINYVGEWAVCKMINSYLLYNKYKYWSTSSNDAF